VHGGGPDGGLALARYRPDGRLDSGFGGGDGWNTTGSVGPLGHANSLAVLRTAHVVVVGQGGTFPSLDVVLARFDR
jgi:hypothetical protein